MSVLFEKQKVFATLVAELIHEASCLGYQVTLGETWRSPEQAQWNADHGKGIANSLHTLRLAIDLNLFHDQKFLTKQEDYQKLGDWWKAQSTDEYTCCWGGDFFTTDEYGRVVPTPDADHFSIEHGGVR